MSLKRRLDSVDSRGRSKKPKTSSYDTAAIDLFCLLDEATWSKPELVSDLLTCLSRSLSSCDAPGLKRTVTVLLGSARVRTYVSAKTDLSEALVSDEGSRLLCTEFRRDALFSGRKDAFAHLCKILGEEKDSASIGKALIVEELRWGFQCCGRCNRKTLHALLWDEEPHEREDAWSRGVCLTSLHESNVRNAATLLKPLLGGKTGLMVALVCAGAVPLPRLKAFAFERACPHRSLLSKPILGELLDAHALKFSLYRHLFSREFGSSEIEFFSRFYVSDAANMHSDPKGQSGILDIHAVDSVVSSLLVLFSCG